MAVATRHTPYGRKRTGLCSGFLASLQVGDVLEVEFKRGSIFNTPIAPPPPHPVPPLILVGPGTGVAPMRSLIQHHCRTRSAGSDHALEDRGVPRMLLFFGCRKQERDCLYSEEWDALNADLDPYCEEQPACKGVRVITAFSQDQLVKNYVTHKIKENAQVVCAMLVQVSWRRHRNICVVLTSILCQPTGCRYLCGWVFQEDACGCAQGIQRSTAGCS